MADDSIRHARMWAACCHASALLMFAAMPLKVPAGGNLLGPLFIWLAKGRDSAFVDDQGRESLNFQLLMTIVAILIMLVRFSPLVTALQIGWAAVNVAFIFVASVKAWNGQAYRYPVALRLIR